MLLLAVRRMVHEGGQMRIGVRRSDTDWRHEQCVAAKIVKDDDFLMGCCCIELAPERHRIGMQSRKCRRVDGDDDRFLNHFFAGLGVSFFFPMRAERSE